MHAFFITYCYQVLTRVQTLVQTPVQMNTCTCTRNINISTYVFVIVGYYSFMVLFFFRNEHWESRANAIRELDNIGRNLIKELGLEKAFSDPLPVAKTKFTSSLTISKDPRMCPTLFFHDTEYFKMVSLLTREPTCVMPIVVNETAQRDIVEGYNLEMKSTDVHVTFRYVV